MKMKLVTMVVEINVSVPDETDVNDFHLGNGLEDFQVEDGGNATSFRVTGYTTVNVIDPTIGSEE